MCLNLLINNNSRSVLYCALWGSSQVAWVQSWSRHVKWFGVDQSFFFFFFTLFYSVPKMLHQTPLKHQMFVSKSAECEPQQPQLHLMIWQDASLNDVSTAELSFKKWSYIFIHQKDQDWTWGWRKALCPLIDHTCLRLLLRASASE